MKKIRENPLARPMGERETCFPQKSAEEVRP